MNDRVLIAYASKSNATADYAGFIAGELTARGISVDQVDLRKTRKPDINGYGVILLGTGVRIGRWYGPAKRCLKRIDTKNQKLAIFVSCGTAIERDKKNEAVRLYIDPFLNKYDKEVISKMAFPGKIPGSKADLRIDADTVNAWVEDILNKANLTS